MSRNISLMDRFMEKVELIPFHTCWEWTANLNGDGYAQFWYNNRTRSASNVSYFLFNGIWPEKPLLVCHSCDNPSCVNPRHLWLGTHADNHRDRNEKGRNARGETHGKSIISDQQVLELRKRFVPKAGMIQILAKEVGMSELAMERLIRGTTWKHLPGGQPVNYPLKKIKQLLPRPAQRGPKENIGVIVVLECDHSVDYRHGYRDIVKRKTLRCRKCAAEASVGPDWASMKEVH